MDAPGSRTLHQSGKPAESFEVKFLTARYEKPNLPSHCTCRYINHDRRPEQPDGGVAQLECHEETW